MANSIIKKCTCDHVSQDELHGKGNRVFNLSQDKQKATCTVCGKVITVKGE